MLRARQVALEEAEPNVVVEPLGFDVFDPVWDVAWLEALREVPDGAVWPRLMSVPHPRAVGSYGVEFVDWVAAHGINARRPLRWFQVLVSVRLLEHDEAGRLVWEAALVTMARQLGKSWWLRELLWWVIHQAERFGTEQEVLHTGKSLDVCKQVQRPARVHAKGRKDGYNVREVNGQEEIEVVGDGSRWLVRAKDAVYGFSATVCAVDEAWKVPRSAIDDGVVPTLVEHDPGLLVLISTAHRLSTSLMLQRRAAALEALAEPDNADLLIEWSAPRAVDLDDAAGWRMASPHWSPRRERAVGKAIAGAMNGETVDPDEPDPLESVRAQWLNQWPLRLTEQRVGGEVLVTERAWASCGKADPDAELEQMWVAVEDNYGVGAAVCAVGLYDDERLEVDGWLVGTRQQALADATALVDEQDVPARILAGVLIPTDLDVDRAGSRETRIGLPLVRSLLEAGRVVHDAVPDLDEQIAGVRVREVMGGLALVSGVRSDLVRAMAWALLAAVVREPVPMIR